MTACTTSDTSVGLGDTNGTYTVTRFVTFAGPARVVFICAMTAADCPGATVNWLTDADTHPHDTRGWPRVIVWLVVLVKRK